MKSIIIAFLTVGLLTACQTKIPTTKIQMPNVSQFGNNSLIIFYDKHIGKTALLNAIYSYQAKILYDYQNFNAIAIQLPNDSDMEEAINLFEKVDGVLMVNRDEMQQLH